MKQEKLKLYTMDMKYVRDLHNVDDSLIRLLDVRPGKKDTAAEKAYKILCAKELDSIQKNQEAIVKKANKLYQMIISDMANQGLKKRCLDFKKLEAVLEKRLNKNTQNMK